MSLSNEIIASCLFLLFISVSLLTRYMVIWHRNIRHTLTQLKQDQTIHNNNTHLENVMESLQPRLLTSDKEESFRNAFSLLYPSAIHRLRTICPHITRNDELLCMLIVLKRTNDEIARTLGISHPSVLQNRYRLRSKLDLPKGSDLDIEICRMLKES